MTSRLWKTPFTEALKLKYPIVQAPCAGHSSAELVAAVSNAGGLGSFGAGMTPAAALQKVIKDIREKTDKPYAINLFCRPTPPPTSEQLQKPYETEGALHDLRADLKLETPTSYTMRSPPLDEQIEVMLQEKVPVVSYTFGILPEDALDRFWKSGAYIIGTATSVSEALKLAGLDPSDPKRKADAIVAQGLEAGGHRGSFIDGGEDVPVETLVSQIKAALQGTNVPVIAAGGISTGEDVSRLLKESGADAVGLGTLFMLSQESATNQAHRQILLKAQGETIISKAWTGKRARGYPNVLTKRLGAVEDIPPYDIHSAKTKDIVGYATQIGNTDYMSLFSGTNASNAAKFSENGTLSATAIFEKLVKEVEAQ
ncbi:2-nitropropane dioxygenase [Backusella circina FSU 941]|nr:2-nitropropane dioxygenase [Backusella circina FSU 941]